MEPGGNFSAQVVMPRERLPQKSEDLILEAANQCQGKRELLRESNGARCRP